MKVPVSGDLYRQTILSCLNAVCQLTKDLPIQDVELKDFEEWYLKGCIHYRIRDDALYFFRQIDGLSGKRVLWLPLKDQFRLARLQRRINNVRDQEV